MPAPGPRSRPDAAPPAPQGRKKQREEAEAAAGEEAAAAATALALGAEHKSREQLVNERIGYKPQPKAGGRAAHFGTFEF